MPPSPVGRCPVAECRLPTCRACSCTVRCADCALCGVSASPSLPVAGVCACAVRAPVFSSCVFPSSTDPPTHRPRPVTVTVSLPLARAASLLGSYHPRPPGQPSCYTEKEHRDSQTYHSEHQHKTAQSTHHTLPVHGAWQVLAQIHMTCGYEGIPKQSIDLVVTVAV